MHDIYDISIIGGGPVGLYAAFYAGLRQAKVKIIESLGILGGQPAHLYPEKEIFDIPAFPSITGAQLIHSLIDQLERFNTDIYLNEEALSITPLVDKSGKSYYAIQTNQQVHYSYSIIIAAGNGAFHPRKLELPNAGQFEQTNLHYFLTDLSSFKDKIVAVCGGGDSALDWALSLEPIARKVYLIHRRTNFRAMEHSVTQIKSSSVEILAPYSIQELHEEQGRISNISLKEVKGEHSINLPIDEFIVSYGFVSSINGLTDWGFETERQTILTNNLLETSLKGIYAIGDIAYYPGKLKIIATGFGEAPLAVNNALLAIYPEKNQAHIHSSSLLK